MAGAVPGCWVDRLNRRLAEQRDPPTTPTASRAMKLENERGGLTGVEMKRGACLGVFFGREFMRPCWGTVLLFRDSSRVRRIRALRRSARAAGAFEVPSKPHGTQEE